MKEYLIPCECGGVYKQLVRDESSSSSPGRSYYRCPVGGVKCLKIWADELFLAKYKKFHPWMKEAGASDHQSASNEFNCGDFEKNDSRQFEYIFGYGNLDEAIEATKPPSICRNCGLTSKSRAKSQKKIQKSTTDKGYYKLNLRKLSYYIDCIAFAISVIMVILCLDIILR